MCIHVHYIFPQLTEGTVDVLSPFEVIAPCDDSIGRLSAEFLFDNFSSTVFGELPGELKEMLRVEATHEDDYDGVCTCLWHSLTLYSIRVYI